MDIPMSLWQYVQENPDVAISFIRELPSTIILVLLFWRGLPILGDAIKAWRESQTQNASSEQRSDEIMLRFVESSSQSQSRMTDVVEALGGKVTTIEAITTHTDEITASISKQQHQQFQYIKSGLIAIYKAMKKADKSNDSANRETLRHLRYVIEKLDNMIPYEEKKTA